MATALMVLLANLGMEVAGPAATVAEAERLAARHRPELAVVDINLKGEMAYDLVSQLHDGGVRVIVVSGYSVLPRLSGKTVAVLQKPARRTGFCRRPAPGGRCAGGRLLSRVTRFNPM